MNLIKRFIPLLCVFFTIAAPVLADTVQDADDGTTLKQIIIFGRHSIRSSTMDPSQLPPISVQSYPPFEVPIGYLTPNGRQAELLLGSYYHDYLLQEGLLTGNAQIDLDLSLIHI